MEKETILIVEDEPDLLDLLEHTLTKEGFDTILFSSITPLLEQVIDEEQIDLILMDRNIHNTDGALFIDKIKSKGATAPVIYLTAKDKEQDILDGFSLHGDDYITKPFNLKELVARIKAVIKRTKRDQEVIKIKEITYKKSNKSFYLDNNKIDLTVLEHKLLLQFIKNHNILLTRDYLIENVWENKDDIQFKTVTVAIKRLKEKIDPDGTKNYIRSIRGEGYIFC